MQNDQYEKLRQDYKPDKVEILFVGESRPQRGAFFYNADSNLYREIKKAFNEYFGKDVFSLDAFKSWGCWLYDICKNPVNGLKDEERKKEIYDNIRYLEEDYHREIAGRDIRRMGGVHQKLSSVTCKES